MKKIFIFTLQNCGHCWRLKKRLKTESIEFNEIDVKLNKNLWESVKNKVECKDLLPVPTIFILDSDDGSGTIYIGERDFKSEDEIIEIIRKSI